MGDDDKAVGRMHVFLRTFFLHYPEHAQRDFYMTGESYAGIYIPRIALAVQDDPSINLRGFAIGNGCMGYESLGACGRDQLRVLVDFFAGHNAIPQSLYASVISECGSALEDASCVTGSFFPLPQQWCPAKCKALLEEVSDAVGGYNVYNFFDTCAAKNDTLQKDVYMSLLDQFSVGAGGRLCAFCHSPMCRPGSLGASQEGALNDYLCGGERVAALWLAQPTTRMAIHARREVEIGAFAEQNVAYTSTTKDLRPDYPSLISRFRILIYSGDVDTCVPTGGSEKWTQQVGLGLPGKSERWRPWTIDGKRVMGGGVRSYADGNFTFATIRGAGHMTPLYKPAESFSVFTHFIRGEPLPIYKTSGSSGSRGFRPAA